MGDTATYRLTLPVPVGTTTHFVLTDTLPGNMTYNGGSLAVILPAGASAGNNPQVDSNGVFFNLAGQTLTLDFGTLTVPAAGNIIVDISTTIQNVQANQDGTDLCQFGHPDLRQSRRGNHRHRPGHEQPGPGRGTRTWNCPKR